MQLTPPVARYEQLAQQLRKAIFQDEFEDGHLPSGPKLAAQAGVSQPVVQRAFEVLAREGLIAVTSGSGTTVRQRRRWRIEFTSVQREAESAADQVRALAHPGISDVGAVTSGGTTVLAMTVETADIGGALEIARRIAREAGGGLEGGASVKPAAVPGGPLPPHGRERASAG